MRILFFGTADFAVPSLQRLVKDGHNVLAVVTQPDKPQGRGMQVASSPVKHAALRLGLPILQPRRVRHDTFVDKVREMAPDLIALAAFGQIVPQAILDIPPYGPINVHGSLLPKYRGAAPIQRAVMAGETVTGVTTMWMDATLDTGDILLSAALDILPDDTAGTLFVKVSELGADLLSRSITGLAAGTMKRIPQDDDAATLAPMLTPEDCAIDWAETAEHCVNRIRGVTPRPGAYTISGNKRLKVWSAYALSEMSALAPGSVIGTSKSPAGLKVAAGQGSVLLLIEVQPESGKRMAADAWARGLRLGHGDRLG